jgi:4-oxalocrotonate tautomerase
MTSQQRNKETPVPYVNIKITREGATAEQKKALIKGVTDLLQTVLNKAPASTFVVIDEVALGTGASADYRLTNTGERPGKSRRRTIPLPTTSEGTTARPPENRRAGGAFALDRIRQALYLIVSRRIDPGDASCPYSATSPKLPSPRKSR